MREQIDPDKDAVLVNKVLGQKASIGPIPADQFFPWVGLSGFSFLLFYMMFGLGIKSWLAASVWLIASYWILTGKESYAYLNKWKLPPATDWINWSMLWVSVSDVGSWKRKTQERIQSIKVMTDEGSKRFMPFQKHSDLHQILQIEIGGHSFGCLLLYEQEKDQWSANIPFKFEGLHPQLYTNEVQEYVTAIRRGMKELLPGEHLEMLLGCYSNDIERQRQLEELADNCDLVTNSVLLRNEQRRLEELTQAGIRQVWQQYFFCTWTAARAGERKQDLIGNTLRNWQRFFNKWTRKLAGTEKIHQDNFYCNIGRQIYEGGYLPWRLLLETKSELKIAPMSDQEIFEWLWGRFNQSKPPKYQHSIVVRETEKGLEKQEPLSGVKDPISVLIQGDQSQSSCPKHRGSQDKVFVKNKICGVLVMKQEPSEWQNQRQQLQWIYQRLSSPYVHDTEAWVSIENADQVVALDNLKKISKQSTTANRRAIEDGSRENVSATDRQDGSLDAQRRIIVEGAKPLHCALVFLVYRDNQRELDRACALLAESFGGATVVREEDIAWYIWLETQPFNNLRLLKSSNPLKFSERRCTLDSKSILGLMPLTRPQPLDRQGVEFLTDKGGQPIYIDLFEKPKRCLIIGESGSGKSSMAWRFVMHALAEKIPVVGIDMSIGGDSTFKQAIAMLGDDGAYIDILSESLNLIEPPDLFGLDQTEQVKRLKHWQDFVAKAIVAIAMGSINDDQQLRERVESLTVRLLEVFFGDPEIIDRYNEAFALGWKSKAWQNIPTLHDLKKFCSKEKLGLTSVEEIDRRAINQIYNQIDNKLADPNIGAAIGKPSSVSPNPKIKFFALSGLSSESNAYVMAISAQMACLRTALSHPRSLFVGDEQSRLLDKKGFSEVLGEFYTTSRKGGLSILTLVTELDSIVRCSASAKILGNNNYVVTGKVTQNTVNHLVNTLKYERSFISDNATQRYNANQAEYYTRWRIEDSGRFWDCRLYPGAMTLAALANSKEEQAARARVLQKYPQTIKGMLEGLGHFSELYIAALKGSISLKSIGVVPANDKYLLKQNKRLTANKSK